MASRHKRIDMPAKASVSHKSAEEELMESVSKIIDDAAETMTKEEFREAAKRSTAILDRAIAAHSRRRGTA
jgi:hypothetical protein